MQTDHIGYAPGVVVLAEVIEKNQHLLAQGIELKKLELINTIPAQIHLWADYNMVDFVLRNLLSNAVKFTQPGGEIRLQAAIKESWIEIKITDTGVGIEPQLLGRAFSFQNPVSTLGTMKEKGTGLGLIMCHEFIRKHEGEITIGSEVGKGTTVTITLPGYFKAIKKKKPDGQVAKNFIRTNA